MNNIELKIIHEKNGSIYINAYVNNTFDCQFFPKRLNDNAFFRLINKIKRNYAIEFSNVNFTIVNN